MLRGLLPLLPHPLFTTIAPAANNMAPVTCTMNTTNPSTTTVWRRRARRRRRALDLLDLVMILDLERSRLGLQVPPRPLCVGAAARRSTCRSGTHASSFGDATSVHRPTSPKYCSPSASVQVNPFMSKGALGMCIAFSAAFVRAQIRAPMSPRKTFCSRSRRRRARVVVCSCSAAAAAHLQTLQNSLSIPYTDNPKSH